MTFSPPRKGIPICNLQKPLPFDKMAPQTLLRCPSCSPRTKILQSWPKQRQRWSVSGPKSHSHFRSSSRGYARKGGARIKQWKWLLHKWMQSDMYRLRLVVTDIISDIFSCIPPFAYHVHEGTKVSWFDLRFDSGRPSLSQREAKSGKSIWIIGREWKEASTLPPRYTKKERSPTVESNKQYYSTTIYVLSFLMPDAGTHDHEASGKLFKICKFPRLMEDRCKLSFGVCVYACKVSPMAAQLFGTSFLILECSMAHFSTSDSESIFHHFFWQRSAESLVRHYDFIPHRLNGHLWNGNRSSTQLNSVECFVLVPGIGCKW